MKIRSGAFIGISAFTWMWAVLNASANCGKLSGSITNLPESDTIAFQVNGLNSKGELTGYVLDAVFSAGHAFIYSAGKVTDAGTLGGDFSQGLGINASGLFVGESQLTGDASSHAILSDGVNLLDLGTLGGSMSKATAINDAGVIAGYSKLADDTQGEGFIYANGSLSSIGNLGGGYSSAFALNSTGVTVGESSLLSGDIHGIAFANGILTDLGTLGGSHSSAFVVNNSGLIVGESFVAGGNTHGFVSSGGVLRDIGTLGGTYSSAYGINDSNQVIGIASTASDAEYHGFVYLGGVLQDLGTLGGDYCTPYAINNAGQVIGESGVPDGSAHAFIWQKGELVDLNTLLPAQSGWELNTAIFINDSGRIVGIGTHNGFSEWFILDVISGNHAPVAVAGPNQSAHCDVQVTLDASQSSDPDGDVLTYQWSSQGFVAGTNATLSGYFPTGTNVLTLQVSDPCGAFSRTNVVVIVTDAVAPVFAEPTLVTLAAGDDCKAIVPDLRSHVNATDNCTPPGALIVTQSIPVGALLGVGRYQVVYSVTDLAGNTATRRGSLRVVDVTPPVIVAAPTAINLAADANCQGMVPNVLGNVIATDCCTPSAQLTMEQRPVAGTVLGKGSHTICVIVKDAAGNRATQNIPFTIADTTAPIIQSVSASPNVLSPPNHQMTPITLSVSAMDNCDASPNNRITSITCNEPTTAGEIVVTGKLTAKLAASRNGARGERIYTITVQSTDNAGNSSSRNVTVTVPQGNGKN